MNTQNSKLSLQYDAVKIPDTQPLIYKPELIGEGTIIHRGIFSPDFTRYYFTVSDAEFTQFDVKYIEKINDSWTTPQSAFFNSKYNEHGMSFSSDGKTVYFSSTRPTGVEGIPQTWHIWKSVKVENTWSKPKFVHIPLSDSLLFSHPSISDDGTLYFHASNPDYSEMHIYSSQLKDGAYTTAQKLDLQLADQQNTCTPYISKDGSYLIFATIAAHLQLHITYKDDEGQWTSPLKLPDNINDHNQGNPYISPDDKFLFYARESPDNQNSWNIYWVSIDILKKP